MNEFIPESLELIQLEQLGRQLSNEVTRLGKIVAGYEVEVTRCNKLYKTELAMAKILNKDSKYSATIINALAETDVNVISASNDCTTAEAILIIGKAELEGRDKQYMMVKKIMDLKIQELRVFRG